MNRMRAWYWLTRNVPQGQILPLYLRIAGFVLFPRQSLLWLVQRDCGFDLMTCCWTIHGVRFSDKVFMAMADPRPGTVYRFKRTAGSSLVWVEALPPPEVGE